MLTNCLHSIDCSLKSRDSYNTRTPRAPPSAKDCDFCHVHLESMCPHTICDPHAHRHATYIALPSSCTPSNPLPLPLPRPELPTSLHKKPTQQLKYQSPKDHKSQYSYHTSAHAPMQHIPSHPLSQHPNNQSGKRNVPSTIGLTGLLNSCFFFTSVVGLPRFASRFLLNLALRMRCSGVCACVLRQRSCSCALSRAPFLVRVQKGGREELTIVCGCDGLRK